MNGDGLTFSSLERQLTQALVSYTLLKGQGAPLIFLWVVGAGLFLVVWPNPLYAALWTGLALVFGALAVRDQLRNPVLQARVLRSLVQQRVPVKELGDSALVEAVERGVNLVAEMVVKIWEMRRTHGEDPALARAIADADALAWLQFRSAKQVQELQRLLTLVAPLPGWIPPSEAGSSARPPSDTGRLHRQAGEAIRQEVHALQALVAEIHQQLETLLLQAVQIETQAGDVIGRVELTQQTAETLEKLHAIAEARRMAAQEIIELLRR